MIKKVPQINPTKTWINDF